MRVLQTGIIQNGVLALVRNMWAAWFVMTGVLVTRFIKKVRDGKRVYIVLYSIAYLSISLASLTFNSGILMHKLRIGNPALFVLASLSGSGFIICLAQLMRKSRTLEYIGRNSMGIMCLHYKTLPIWAFVMFLTRYLDNSPNWLSIPVRLITLLFASLGVTLLIAKIFPAVFGRRKEELNNDSNGK